MIGGKIQMVKSQIAHNLSDEELIERIESLKGYSLEKIVNKIIAGFSGDLDYYTLEAEKKSREFSNLPIKEKIEHYKNIINNYEKAKNRFCFYLLNTGAFLAGEPTYSEAIKNLGKFEKALGGKK